MKRAVWISLAVFFFVNAGWPICLPQSVKPEAFQYTMALIDSFSYAKSSWEKLGEIDNSSDFTEMIYHLKSAQEDYKCAARIVGAYAKNKDKTIAASAEAAQKTYEALLRLHDDLVVLIKSVLDGAGKPGWSQAEFTEKLAESRVAMDETWKILPPASVLATYVLVQMPSGNQEKLSSFRITSENRKLLMEKIEQEFGPLVRSGMKGGQHALVASAALLYQFVSNTDWKSSDSK